MKSSRPFRPRSSSRKRTSDEVTLYKLIKTTKNNVIIRKEGTKKIALLKGATQKLLRKDEIEDYGYCLKLSYKLFASKHVAGNFGAAIQAAKELLDKEESSSSEAPKEKEEKAV